jgi:hypothetical protein
LERHTVFVTASHGCEAGPRLNRRQEIVAPANDRADLRRIGKRFNFSHHTQHEQCPDQEFSIHNSQTGSEFDQRRMDASCVATGFPVIVGS